MKIMTFFAILALTVSMAVAGFVSDSVTLGTNKLTIDASGTLKVNETPITGGGGSSSTTVFNLTYISTNIYTYANSGDVFRVTLTNNVILRNPSNSVDGKALTWWVSQDSTGERTIDLDTHFKIPSSASLPLAWSTNPLSMTMFAARYNAAKTNWYVISLVPGY